MHSTASLPARRVVHETAAQWKSAKLLTITAQNKWCKSGDDAGCDFKSIDDALVLPDGGLIASGAMGPIHHFAPGRTFIKALGATGKGPGEYGFVVRSQLVKDQLVWFDNTQMRLTSVSISGTPGPITLSMLPRTTENIYFVDGTLTVFDVPVNATLGDTVVGVYRTVPPTGTPRSFARIRTPGLFAPGSEGFRRAGPPFSPRAKRAVTQEDRDSVESNALKTFRVSNVISLPPAVRAQDDVKLDWFPPLTSIFVLRDGTVWIRPRPAAGETTARWDVFTRNGVRLGRAQLAMDARVVDGARDWVLFVEENADDVPTVVKNKVQ